MVNAGGSHLHGVNNGSIERINDGNSSATSNCRLPLATEISNIEQVTFCIEQDIGGHLSERKISEVLTLKAQNIQTAILTLAPLRRDI